MTSEHYALFLAELREASGEALAEAGDVGVKVAKANYHAEHTSGETKRSIGWRLDGHHFLEIFVGTLRGVFMERGTKIRERRGKQEARPYLRPGLQAAMRVVLPAMRVRMGAKTHRL
jgi:hypothetical protein